MRMRTLDLSCLPQLHEVADDTDTELVWIAISCRIWFIRNPFRRRLYV